VLLFWAWKARTNVTTPLYIARELKPAHLEQIGRVAVNWSFLEYDIKTVVLHSLNIKEAQLNAVVGRFLNAERLIDAAKQLVSSQHPDLADRVAELCRLANASRKRRNEMLHDLWFGVYDGAEEMTGNVARIKWGVGPLGHYSVKDIADIADEMESLRGRFMTEIFTRYVPPTLPPKRQPAKRKAGARRKTSR
jgi:hypothetical protein